MVDTQYAPLLDRPLKLKAVKGASLHTRSSSAGGGHLGSDREGSEPETWHWVPEQAVSMTTRAIAMVRVGRVREGEGLQRGLLWHDFT